MAESKQGLLERVAATTARLAGDGFVRGLLRALAEELAAAVAFVAVADEDRHDRLHVVAWSRLDEVDHDVVDDGPSLGPLLDGDPAASARRLRERFAGDPVLGDPRIESAFAVPLIGSDGSSLGQLAILSTAATAPDAEQVRVLRILASRAAVEVERYRAERAFRALHDEQGALLRIATQVAEMAPSERLLRSVTTEAGLLYEGDTARTLRFEGAQRARVAGCWAEDGNLRVALDERIALADDAAAAEVLRTGEAARVDGGEGEYGSVIAAPVVVAGRIWGVMSVARSGDRPFPERAEWRLGRLAEIFAQAIANLEAREQLAASRARLVEAADRERRRLERNLHDGAQQRLVALALSLRLAETSLARDPNAVELVREASAELAGALEELRELARGIHPALLSNRGLVAAVEGLIARTPLTVDLEASVPERMDEPVEVAAYYVVTEALTNVAKYSGAAAAAVRLVQKNGLLRVEVEDKGAGGADAARGSGLSGLADRVEVLGGLFEVRSRPGEGTLVRAEFPSRRQAG